ncbi:MAG: hypothetical protein PUP92_39345 [Rhizonema sp. PD38]|nr:hypothetical protein [Rhizonema sp. PD38]
MTEKRQPQTPEEIQADIESHPERGKINDEYVLALDRREVRGSCSGESKRKLIRIMAVYGWDMSEGLSSAIAALWDKERQNVEAHEREKAEYFNVDTKEVRNKQFGIYKDRGRRKKANLQYKPSDED